MSKKVLTTPIQDKDLEDIKIGDVIYLTGYLVTARDAAHTRLVKLGRKLPVDLKGKAIFHAGPIMVRREDDPTKFRVVSIGPIVLLYPFLQKYFAQGMQVGAVKG